MKKEDGDANEKRKRKKHVQTSFVTQLNQNEYCKTCWSIKHEDMVAADHEFTKINFRLRQRGMEDLDSDEDGAYRGWSESEDEDDF